MKDPSDITTQINPKCPVCGSAIPRESPDGLCPVCLLGGGMEGERAGPVGIDREGGDPGAGEMIGRYKLLQEIGEGGFGIVYLAEQTEPVKRRVALKVIKPGMDSREVVARFEAERQALALLNHSNIAQVHDAGTTTSGRPYFVMEFVKGKAITEYCDDRKLSVKDRVGLMATVCRAFQQAHSKGLVHRDIKPSNVLVADEDGQPVPKIIDFGVAKSTVRDLTDKTLFTMAGQMIGTPVYMSPEQAGGEMDIDHRTDIYSLGVLLYEMLTGSTPLDKEAIRKASVREIERATREFDPAKPSQKISGLGDQKSDVAAHRGTDPSRLTQTVRGDLDWTVMKALEKDPNRRYESASALASDLERFLRNEPVEAGPPSVTYKIRKFAQRRRGVVMAALAIPVVALAAGVMWPTDEYQGWTDEDLVRETVNRSDFDLELAVADPIEVHRNGELVAFRLKPSVDCWLGLLQFAKGDGFDLLFPNAGNPDGFLRGGIEVTVPNEASGFEFEISHRTGVETVFAVACTDKRDYETLLDDIVRGDSPVFSLGGSRREILVKVLRKEDQQRAGATVQFRTSR